ncbi:unnamed protein product [Plutella xylostella]|uniref:(diamondback moth) hypothetical protein n=1 Tax=Plutella xylostella TaxID=51655 RepID=A0A8S4G951_PLUXY|nr:unnamed protein product [Plutella xylostella]
MSTTKRDMDILIKKRSSIKGKLTRVFNFASQLDPKSTTPTHHEVRVRLEHMNSVLIQFEEIQDSIEESEQYSQEHEEERATFENRYYQTKALMESFLGGGGGGGTTTQPATTQHECTAQRKPQVKLPQLELPRFDGDVRQWPAFKNIFYASVDSADLPTVNKLQYLKSALTGEAAGLVNSLLITEENYTKALDILNKRYENKTLIVNFHLKAMLNFTSISKFNLKEFLVILQQSLDSLKAIHLPVDKWDTLLVFLISQKLDNSLRAAWEINRKDSSIATMSELLEFLNLRRTAFELLNDNKTQQSPQHSRIKIQDANGKWITARALLDTGSEVNIVTRRLALALQLKENHNQCTIQGVGNSHNQTQVSVNANISSHYDNYQTNLTFLVMNNITMPLPHTFIDTHSWNIPNQPASTLADPTFYKPGAIDLLIGAELFYDTLQAGHIKLGPNMPHLIQTTLGWVVSGPVNTNLPSGTQRVNMHVSQSTESLLNSFWEQEEMPPVKLRSPEDKYYSNIVLCWIKAPYKHKHDTYVSHRLMQIIDTTNGKNWYYINTKQNPADLITRGVMPKDLPTCQLWWQGAPWMANDLSSWPILTPSDEDISTHQNKEEKVWRDDLDKFLPQWPKEAQDRDRWVNL